VTDVERFLLAGVGVSVATRRCYVRHVRAMLAEVGDATRAYQSDRASRNDTLTGPGQAARERGARLREPREDGRLTLPPDNRALHISGVEPSSDQAAYHPRDVSPPRLSPTLR
jgi:hypothetical protein